MKPFSQNSSSTTRRVLGIGLSVIALGVLAGCEQTRAPGYYEPARASTTKDAMRQAQGGPSGPSMQPAKQVQIKRGKQSTRGMAGLSEGEQVELTTQREIAALIPKPQTYHGTLPCFHEGMQCTSQNITLTLAPNGEWRLRAEYTNSQSAQSASGQPFTAQGCWRLIPMTPPNLVILGAAGNVRAEMLFMGRNTLQVKTIDGESPNLTYTLTRQPDLDPIPEMDAAAPLDCR